MLRKWQLFQDFRARYDADWDRVKKDGWEETRRQKLAKVRDSWTLSDESKQKMSRTHRSKTKKTCVSFHAKSPEGQIYFANVISDFAREMNLHVHCFHQFVRQRGTCRTYKKWTLPTEPEITAARAAGTLIEKIYRQPPISSEQAPLLV
jgi:hypothetical protein